MTAEIISNVMLNEKFGYIEMKCAELAKERNPGRFFMISTTPDNISSDPLLKRPFAICEVKSDDIVTFLYMVVGRGTKLLTKLVKGDVLSITGPVGNFFNYKKDEKVALVAGGIGLAPMINLMKPLREAGCNITLFYGGRSESDLLLRDKLTELSDEQVFSTDDGSFGHKGFVITPFKERLQEFDRVYACGPNRMLNAVTDICIEGDKPVLVSLDQQMGCGVGACLGCLIPTVDKAGEVVQKRCCVEGPVFDGRAVHWQELIG